jgi:hypothetical protein
MFRTRARAPERNGPLPFAALAPPPGAPHPSPTVSPPASLRSGAAIQRHCGTGYQGEHQRRIGAVLTALAKLNSTAKGQEERHEMKAFITSAAAGAVVLAGVITAPAQPIVVNAPATVELEGTPRLPNFFKNCEEPLPWYCASPPGLLWLGSIATLQHERRKPSLRASREFPRRFGSR